jgi:hypothetical protein
VSQPDTIAVGLVLPPLLFFPFRGLTLTATPGPVHLQVPEVSAGPTAVDLFVSFRAIGGEGDPAESTPQERQAVLPTDPFDVISVEGQPFGAVRLPRAPAAGVGHDDPQDEASQNRQRHVQGLAPLRSPLERWLYFRERCDIIRPVREGRLQTLPMFPPSRLSPWRRRDDSTGHSQPEEEAGSGVQGKPPMPDDGGTLSQPVKRK